MATPSEFKTWPTAAEIRPTTPDIAYVKDFLLARDIQRATDALLDILYRTAAEATNLGHVLPSALMGFVRSLEITVDVDTASVNVQTGQMRISPIFFLRFIHSVRDLVWIIVHEREHRIIRLLHGSPYAGLDISRDAAGLAEDVFIEANTRYILRGPTGNDEVQLVAQSEQRVRRGEQPLPVLNPASRYTLATSAWRMFDGPQQSAKYMEIIDSVEQRGASSTSYAEYVRAWLIAFPRERGSGEGMPVFGYAGEGAGEKQPPSAGSGASKDFYVERKPLPLTGDPAIVETILRSLHPKDSRRKALQTLAQHATWSRQMADTVVSDILSYAHQDPTLHGTSLYPVLDRSTWTTLALGAIPARYTAHYEYRSESPAYALYVDVSGSMDPFYGVIVPLARMLGSHCHTIRQFSTFVKEVDVDCRHAYTGNGTNYNCVVDDALAAGFQNLIVLTDNTEKLSEKHLKRARAAHLNVYLISTRTKEEDNYPDGFNAIARKRVDLSVIPK